MSGFRGRDESGRVVEGVTPVELRELLQGAGELVRLEQDGPGTGAAEARRVDGQRWRLLVTDAGAADLVAEVPNTDAAFDVLRSWAAADGWWRDAFSWQSGEVPD